MIEVDLDRRTCDLLVDDAELQRRRAAWQRPAPVNDTGWLKIYRANVSSMPQGAVLTGGRAATASGMGEGNDASSGSCVTSAREA